MARINGNLDRRAAKTTSYRELDDEDEVETPDTISHRCGKRNILAQTESSPPHKKRKRRIHANASTDDESEREQHDTSHATGENSRVRIDQVIQDLVKAGKDTLVYCDTTPLKTEPQVHPPALDLRLLKLSTDALLFLDDSVLYGYLTSNDFLPCIAQWKKECIDNPQLRSLILAALPDDKYPFVETATYIAQTAPKYVSIIEEHSILNHPHAEIMLICLKYVWRLKRCTMAHFMHFLREARYPCFEEFIYMFCTRAMLTVYADLRLHGVDGFFAIMLDSRFAEPMTMKARKAWDKLLILPSNSSGANTATSVSTIQAASLAYAESTGFQSYATPLSEEASQELHFKVEAGCWKLRTAFLGAVGDNPELKIIIPSDVGQTEASKSRKREKKAGRPPQFKREMVSFCDSDCTPKTDTHSRGCTDRLREAQEKWRQAKGSVEADVPDQEPARVDSTFQQKQSTLIPPEQVISRFNQRDVVEPFSDEEKLLALRRFRLVLDLAEGDLVDGAFEWTMISEVLAGRGVADCVRFYYQHKHIIFMKLKKRPDPEQPFVPTGVPEWGEELSHEKRRQLEGIIDVNRFEDYMATLQARNTDLRIRNEMLEADTVRMRSSEQYERNRADENMQSYRKEHKEVERLKDQLKTVLLQKKRDNEDPTKELKAENESLKKQLAESKEEQEKLIADGKKLADFQESYVRYTDGRADLLEEELREVKQELMPKSSNGQGFLANIFHIHTPKQWRGEM